MSTMPTCKSRSSYSLIPGQRLFRPDVREVISKHLWPREIQSCNFTNYSRTERRPGRDCQEAGSGPDPGRCPQCPSSWPPGSLDTKWYSLIKLSISAENHFGHRYKKCPCRYGNMLSLIFCPQ